MPSSAAQKRQRTPSDEETALTGRGCQKRLQNGQTLASVEHATATDSSRMLNGHVHGNNIHGNASTVINNFHAGPCGNPDNTDISKAPGILSKTERDDLLERLRFPQLDARLTNLRKAQSHTCKWIGQRKDYRTWLDSKDLQACDGFFWIKGNPGTGKSITMKFLYQTMQRQARNSKDKLVISFFFKARGNDFEKSTLGLYRSLLFNLFNLEPALQEALDHCRRSGYHHIIESGWQLQMLKEVFEEAIFLLHSQGKQLYCFVDALDECPEDDVQDVVSYFEDLVSSTDSRDIRVCFSSRHYPQISIRTRLTITLEKETKHDEDIKVFVESQLRFGEDVDTDLLQHIRDTVLQKSSGIFLWVNLVVHQLNEVYRKDGRIKSVQQRLQNIPTAVMKQTAPSGALTLYGLFQDIILKDDKKIDELVRIAQIIYCARRPLQPTELHILLHRAYGIPFDSSEIPDKFLRKHILEVSKGLVEVTKSTKPTVQFIHETVREFLRDGGLKNISTQSIDCDGHETLKMSCLEQIHAPISAYLDLLAEYRRRGEFRNAEVHQVIRQQQKEFQDQATEKFPFLEYASKNILFHAEEAEALGFSQREFLEGFHIRMEGWISVYNLFEKFNTRRYYGKTTPMLYILAEHGCNHLIQTSTTIPGQYIFDVEGNEFPSALVCAIYNDHLDAAWALAGLEAKGPRQAISAPTKASYRPGEPLLQLLLRLGDVQLLRKVLRDCHAMNSPMPTDINFAMVRSAEMIDVYLEVSNVPGFPSLRYHDRQSQAYEDLGSSPRKYTDLKFIRKAIETDPSLLQSKAWGERTMFDYSIGQGLLSLVSLYLEYSGGGQSNADAVLHSAAREGQLEVMKLAIRHNANLGSQNELGETALHLASAHVQAYHTWGRYDSTIRYLLSADSPCTNVRDFSGRTPLCRALASTSRYMFFFRKGGRSNTLFEAFVQSGADVNTVVDCPLCAESEGHLVPVVTAQLLEGIPRLNMVVSVDGCDLNGRDNFGRTALSWCLGYRPRHGHTHLNHFKVRSHREIAVLLLRQQTVDVNSRDKSGYTVLEHFIRQPREPLEFPIDMFFQSERLDCNLQTSDDQHPLELIISLYNMWPTEFGAIDAEPDIRRGIENETEILDPGEHRRETRQRKLNEHLIKAGELLLGTEKVDFDVQRRCEARAPPELKRIMEQHRRRHDQSSRTVLAVADLCN